MESLLGCLQHPWYRSGATSRAPKAETSRLSYREFDASQRPQASADNRKPVLAPIANSGNGESQRGGLLPEPCQGCGVEEIRLERHAAVVGGVRVGAHATDRGTIHFHVLGARPRH